MEYDARNVIYYVAKRLRCFYEVGMLRLLVFLAQYDVNPKARIAREYRCGGRPLARAEFYLWPPDVVSDQLYDALEAVELDLVMDAGGSKLCYGGLAPQLPQPVAMRLSAVVNKYGKLKMWELQRHIKKLMGWNIEERYAAYVGHTVYAYFYREGFKFAAYEICE
jgi:hypothetical protein